MRTHKKLSAPVRAASTFVWILSAITVSGCGNSNSTPTNSPSTESADKIVSLFKEAYNAYLTASNSDDMRAVESTVCPGFYEGLGRNQDGVDQERKTLGAPVLVTLKDAKLENSMRGSATIKLKWPDAKIPVIEQDQTAYFQKVENDWRVCKPSVTS